MFVLFPSNLMRNKFVLYAQSDVRNLFICVLTCAIILYLFNHYSLPLFPVFAAQMLMDYISGRLGGPNDIKLASKVVRVIVAGNSVVTSDVTKGKDRLVGAFIYSLISVFICLFIHTLTILLIYLFVY